MEIQQLRYLISAADSSSYARAAKECFTSRQNVAHSIKLIENELGVTIFVREGNGMTLTREGRQVVRRARGIITRVDSLRTMFMDIDGEESPLDVSLGVNFIAGIPDATDRYFFAHSRVLRLAEMSPDLSYDSVISGRSDVAFVMCMQRTFPHLKTVELARSQAYALVNANTTLASTEGLRIEDLRDHRLLLMSEPPFQYSPLLAELEEVGYDMRDASVIPSSSTMVHLVKAGNAVGFVSRLFASHPPRGTVAVPLLDSRVDWHFSAMYKRDAARIEMIARVVDDVRETFVGAWDE
jgi:DNA-binding transcriptional LysR family regulator